MLKRTMAATLAIMIALVAGPVAAQVCTVGVYADSEGLTTNFQPIELQAFDVYVVLFVESTVTAVGYSLNIVDGAGLLAGGVTYGRDGMGLNVPTAGGENVGLGECAVGFIGRPVVVAKYSFLPLATATAATFSVSGNPDASSLDPTFPAYSNCQGLVDVCQIGPSLTVEAPVDNDSESFGAVKSLYNN